jgi:hypothetical protein
MSDTSDQYLTIECPSCQAHTNLRSPNEEKNRCPKCHESYYGFTFRRVKKLSQGLVALSCLLGGAGAATVMTESRLSVVDEYRLMELCVSGDQRVLSMPIYAAKQDTCGCIVSKAIEDIDIKWSVISDERYDKWLLSSMKEAEPSCR